jgi:hypothetical protein
VDALLLRAGHSGGVVRGARPRRSATHAVDGGHVPRRPAHLAPGGTSAPGNPLLVELITRVLLSHYVFGAIAMLAILLVALGTGGPAGASQPRIRG